MGLFWVLAVVVGIGNVIQLTMSTLYPCQFPGFDIVLEFGVNTGNYLYYLLYYLLTLWKSIYTYICLSVSRDHTLHKGAFLFLSHHGIHILGRELMLNKHL